MTHSLPKHECPSCGERLDAATSICEDSPPPSVGDVTLCIVCGAVMVFTTGLGVEVIEDPSTLPGMDAETLRDIRRAQRAIEKAKEHGA